MTARIVITGAQGSGKTRLSEHLRQAYELRGRRVQIKDADDSAYLSPGLGELGQSAIHACITTAQYGAGELNVRVSADAVDEAIEALHFIAEFKPPQDRIRVEEANVAPA